MRAALATLLAAFAAVAAAAPPAPARVRLPDGVRLQRFASGIPNPSNLAFDRKGRLWVTSAGFRTAPSDGVWMVPRRGARPRHVVTGLFSALGLAWHRRELYVSHVVPYATFAPGHTGRVVAYSGFDGRGFARRRVVVDGIPTGQHRVDSIAPGPDGRLYLGVGSQSDHERSPRDLSATVVSFRPGGGGLRVEARGLRNPYGLAFVPGTSALLVSEHGRDDLGAFRPRDELNRVQTRGPARWYGFPECWGQSDPACRRARAPLARLESHSAPGAVAVAAGFGRWGPSAFVARFGSSFSEHPSGGDVVRVPLGRDGAARKARARRFARGFGLQQPLGLALGPDGALYVTLWTSGRIVRLVPEERPAASAASAPGSLTRVIAEVMGALCAALAAR